MLPIAVKPKLIEKKGNLGVFEIEPLYPGYGVTIGNSLRRVLLSSLPGAAITQVKIKGAQHEFSTIPGVLEDVIHILLNLKQLRFKFFTQEPQLANLKVKGEKTVKGSDFKLSPQVELVNKDAHIATLTSKQANLEIEVQIEKGLGYELAEKRKKEKTEIGVILLDSIFTPVHRVSYRVENMRVGERTDFERLHLEIETDGTVTPEDAFSQASEILLKHFALFTESSQKAVPQPSLIPEVSEDITKKKVEDLKFSTRTLNALLKGNVKTVGGVLRRTEKNLLELEGMGGKGIQEIKKALKKLNLGLRE